MVYRDAAMQHLKTNGVVIHLDLELNRIKKRLDDINARGVVIAPGPTLDALYAERQPLYAKYADVTVKTDTHDFVAKGVFPLLAYGANRSPTSLDNSFSPWNDTINQIRTNIVLNGEGETYSM